MRKDILLALVHDKVNAGQAKPTSSVWKEDLEAYLPAAVNEAVMEGYFIQAKAEGDRDIPTQFFAVFDDIPVLIDEKSELPYFNVPAVLMALPSNRAWRQVYSDSGAYYAPVPEAAVSSLDYWLNIFCGERFFRPVAKRVYLYNHPNAKLNNKINAITMVDVDEIAPNGELPIPAGLEAKVIDNLYNHAMGIRKEPADRVADGRDIN